MRRILITGAGGFIGSHLTEALVGQGRFVRALVRYNGHNSWGHLDHFKNCTPVNLEIRLGDVADPGLMEELVSGCDVIYHLAALIGIPYSYAAPSSYVATNIGGTLAVLEACRKVKVKRLIITSTSEVYGTPQTVPILECHPLQAQSPYAATKIAADKLAESYWRSFALPVVTVRPFNTFGPRQSARAVLPTILTQILGGSTLIELGNLAPRRDWLFVADTVKAFILAAEAPNIEGETIHFGSGVALSVNEAAERCLSLLGADATVVSTGERERPLASEVGVLQCNYEKARRLLDWSPQYSFDQGINETVDFLRANLAQYTRERYVV